MIKTLCMIVSLGFACRAPMKAVPRSAFVPTASATNPLCTWSFVPNGTCPTCTDIVLSAGCTAADIFRDVTAGDFHLVPGLGSNPAIGNATCLDGVPVDKDGNPRPTPGRPPGAGCDVGAYQYTDMTLPNPPTNLRLGGITP